MVPKKSLDELVNLIAALLRDLQTSHSEVFDQRALRLTIAKINKRIAREGIGFLTKTLPRLGKALDRALTGETILDSTKVGFKPIPGSKLPIFMGELFQLCFSHDGQVLTSPCVRSIKHLRQILFVFYKLDLPYNDRQEMNVISQFIKTEDDIKTYDNLFNTISDCLDSCAKCTGAEWPLVRRCDSHHSQHPSGYCASPLLARKWPYGEVTPSGALIIRRIRRLLNRVFEAFNPIDILPRHGPGAVSTKERLWAKFEWKNVPQRLTSMYPLDAYFYASLGHVCDAIEEINSLGDTEDSARVLLVPKDSRGPRLISCEPSEFQWIQQGLGAAIVRHVEHCALTKHNVHFTDQQPNQIGALLGSRTGSYATLDLKEASDRVTVGLVRLLFPSKVLPYLLAARSLSTVLPDGGVLNLRKFAPMGSALCFPIMALTIWAILTAGCTDADTRESILVYGDDVVVPRAYARRSIELLESFGLLVNRDKSCLTGFFRESCGVDAFEGHDVTPLRLRNLWASSPNPNDYPSRVAFANSCWDNQYYNAYEYITKTIYMVYNEVPSDDMLLTCPSLRSVPDAQLPRRHRTNKSLQKRQFLVWDVGSRRIRHEMSGWRMLLRYFTEGASCQSGTNVSSTRTRIGRNAAANAMVEDPWIANIGYPESLSVREYTKRNTMKIVKRWR